MSDLFEGAQRTVWLWLTETGSNELFKFLKFVTWCMLLYMVYYTITHICSIAMFVVGTVKAMLPKKEQQPELLTNDERALKIYGALPTGCKVYLIDKRTSLLEHVSPRHMLPEEYDKRYLVPIVAMSMEQALRKFNQQAAKAN